MKMFKHKITGHLVKFDGFSVYEWDNRFNRWWEAYYILSEASMKDWLTKFEEVPAGTY